MTVELVFDGRGSLDDVHEVGDGGWPLLDDVGNALLVAHRRFEGLNHISREEIQHSVELKLEALDEVTKSFTLLHADVPEVLLKLGCITRSGETFDEDTLEVRLAVDRTRGLVP